MNIDQIKTFHMVAAAGSFTKAARELFLTQSAVSQQIRALEDEIGGRLFDRSGKRIHLTGEGEVLLTYAERLFDLHEEIETLFGSLRTLQKGKITVGATAVIGTYFMPAVISAFHRQYPGVKIDLRMGNSEQILRMILDREVDLGIAGMVKKHASLESAFVHGEKLLFVCSPMHPLATREKVTPGELERIPFIWREKGTQTLALVKRWFRANAGGNFPHQTLSVANMEAAKRIVEEGYGVTIIPVTAARREIEAGMLKHLDVKKFDLTVDYGLFYPKGRIFSRAAEAFLETLCDIGIFSHGENLRNLLGDHRKSSA
ncbi:MAG: LysR family transcriptional regulator [Deltaproteobacteria bacterium]|nr:LysR family transcriptional regulator [Deltaproteobacteria bacterium]